MFKLDFNDTFWIGYVKGHLHPFWKPEDYQNLPYTKEKITRKPELKQWAEFGYPKNTNFEGYMYNNKNPMPKFVKQFEKIFNNITNLTYTLYRMDTVTIMPEHVDHFTTYKKLFNVPDEKVIRILVMLEDWQPGHYLEVNGQGIVNWKAGDFFAWKHDVPHAASNIGKNTNPRYTLQITATLKENEGPFDDANKLYSFNMPFGNSIVDSHIIDRIQIATNNNHGLPYLVYLGNGPIKNIKKHIAPNQINGLNLTGLDIYLYEPLCSYIEWQKEYVPGGSKHSEVFYSEFPNHINRDFLRADELDSIQELINDLGLTEVRVHTCDYDIKKHYPYYKNINLLYDDIFVKSAYFRKVLDPNFHDSKFTVKFLSLNYRYTFHRHLVCAYLVNYNANISWPYKCEYEHASKGPYYNLVNHVWNNNREHIRIGMDKLNSLAPLTLDFNFSEPTVIEHNYFKPRYPNNQTISDINLYSIEKFYKESFCEIVCESRFAQPTANYSEKVFEPMYYYRPFILVAPPHTLKVLREHGFKTFGEFWDESYDDIEDHEERLNRIFTLISDIDILPIETCNELHKRMMPVLEHNYRLLRSKLLP